MKMRARKTKKIRCERQSWVDSGLWAAFYRSVERYMSRVRAERIAYLARGFLSTSEAK